MSGKKLNLVIIGIRKMTENSLRETMLKVGELNGVEPTENFDKIVRAKELMKLGLDCPCDKDNHARYCISDKCFNDIQKFGECHCHCWRLK